MNLKFLCRRMIKRFGFDIIRSMPGYKAVRFPEVGAVISPLDFVLRNRLKSENDDFYFVQIGANDGIRFDPIRHLIFEFKLKGVLVEPLPDIFNKLKKNYHSQTQLRFENAAISKNDGTGLLWRFRPDAPVPDKCHGMARFSEYSIRKLARQYHAENYVEKIPVSLVSFEQLARKHRIKKIDFLQIDTEGYDLEILKMVMNSTFKPEVINYEFVNLSLKDRLYSCALLSRNGYEFIHGPYDTLAILGILGR